MHQIYSLGGVKNPYEAPQIEHLQFVSEAGFTVSNDNLTEENCGWDN